MLKIYRFTKILPIFLSLLCLGLIIILALNSKDIYFHPTRFWLGIISLIFLLLSFPEILTKKWILEEKGISEKSISLTKFYKENIKRLDWNNIVYIVDDYVQPILFYPPYKLHIFHIIPKNNIPKKFRRISISPSIKNYKDLLLKVVSNVGPDVKIDDYVYKFLDKYKETLKTKERRAVR